MKSAFSLSTFSIVGNAHMSFFLIASSHSENLSKIVTSVQIYKGFFALGMCCPFFYIVIVIYVYLSMCLSRRKPWGGSTGGCELPDVGAGDHTRVPCKSSA